ncbi:hypothetical protein GCK32_016764 [Trichostrongylus colubriformis]|uniref:Uncharacterized protein n=1 Tax=Trichostrongylus colubriformis TaxID=6319 RepID=A0AAN8IME7_TRICO
MYMRDGQGSAWEAPCIRLILTDASTSKIRLNFIVHKDRHPPKRFFRCQSQGGGRGEFKMQRLAQSSLVTRGGIVKYNVLRHPSLQALSFGSSKDMIVLASTSALITLPATARSHQTDLCTNAQSPGVKHGTRYSPRSSRILKSTISVVISTRKRSFRRATLSQHTTTRWRCQFDRPSIL